MNLKWCAFTGALMLAFVAATFYHKEVTQDPPGVSTRWWDGTLQSTETKYDNGKLERRTTYGDDGKTVLTLEEWSWEGVLVHSKIRSQKNGRVEEKMFQADGKTLSFYKLWNGDEQTFVIDRRFQLNGKLESEAIMTEDGLNATIQRTFDSNGDLSMERQVLDNADQSTSTFANGKLTERSIFKANGDSLSEQFDENGKLQSRFKQVRRDGTSVFETFDADGKVGLRRENDSKSTNLINITVFEGDKVKLRQFLKDWQLWKTEEVSTATGFTTRTIEIEYGKTKTRFEYSKPFVRRVELYRADGTLERVKLLKDDGSVEKTIEYDPTGLTVTSEKEGGEAEKIDEKLIQDATRAGGQ
jgi:antitoxin component YwqK of YwqJK toxin-antitoxin module